MKKILRIIWGLELIQRHNPTGYTCTQVQAAEFAGCVIARLSPNICEDEKTFRTNVGGNEIHIFSRNDVVRLTFFEIIKHKSDKPQVSRCAVTAFVPSFNPLSALLSLSACCS
jgi:hypothetical protein